MCMYLSCICHALRLCTKRLQPAVLKFLNERGLLARSFAHDDFQFVHASRRKCIAQCLVNLPEKILCQFFDRRVHNWQFNTVDTGKGKARTVLAFNAQLLVRFCKRQHVAVGGRQKMLVQAFAFGPDHLFYVPKIHDVPVRPDLMRPELQPNLVVVPVQLFTESFVGDKMRGIEFEIFFHDAYFVGGGGGHCRCVAGSAERSLR